MGSGCEFRTIPVTVKLTRKRALLPNEMGEGAATVSDEIWEGASRDEAKSGDLSVLSGFHRVPLGVGAQHCPADAGVVLPALFLAENGRCFVSLRWFI